MANIIDTTFFDGNEINIAGLEKPEIADIVTDFITKYEPDYLNKALSYPLWKSFKADNYPNPATQRFIDLKNGGVEWTDDRGNLHLWEGLNKISLCPIADYVWYYYQRNNASFSTSTGESKGKSENSTNISVATKQMRAYNEMSRYTECQLWGYLKHAKNGDETKRFPEFKIEQAHCFGKLNTLNI